jgi:hypothetical protein
MTGGRALVALLASVLTIALASPVRAQQAPPARGAQSERRVPAPRKILRLEEMKVEGRIQKPQAMFLMPRANLNYGELDRSEPFVPKIVGATEKAPF